VSVWPAPSSAGLSPPLDDEPPEPELLLLDPPQAARASVSPQRTPIRAIGLIIDLINVLLCM
jgi:hypothetical protein